MYRTGWPEQAGHYSIPQGGYFLNKLLLQYVCMFSLKRILLFYIMIMTERPIGQKPIAFGGIGTYLKVHICLILKNRTQLGIGLA